jgi:hypothetical protein
MNTHTELVVFLKALEVAIPPPEKAHHAIIYCRYGVEHDFEDRLAVQLVHKGKYWCLFLDESDFRKPSDDLVAECVKLVASDAPGVQHTKLAVEPPQ